jgi:hypothetical protein
MKLVPQINAMKPRVKLILAPEEMLHIMQLDHIHCSDLER